MTGSQQDTTSGLANTDQVASSRCAKNAILSDQELLDAIGGTDLGNLGDHLRVVVTAITTNDEERVFDTLGDRQQNAGNEGFGVMGLLEDLDLLAKTRTETLLEKRNGTQRGIKEVPTFPASGP